MTVELAGQLGEHRRFFAMVKPYGIKEIVRSGAIAIAQAKDKERSYESTRVTN